MWVGPWFGFHRGAGNAMRNTHIPDDDAARLAALREYDILDTPPEFVYDEITEIVA